MNRRLIQITLFESVKSALKSFLSNVLRTLLSLSGVTIGVFCIIAILSAVDSMESSLKKSVSKLGDNTIYIQKWPWAFSNEYPWWKYMNRPPLRYQDMQLLTKRYQKAEAISFNIWINGKTLKHQDNSADGITCLAASHSYESFYNFDLEQGRYFTEAESRSGAAVLILGYELGQTLFPEGNGIGKKVQALGRKLTVIGINSKDGEALGADFSIDKAAVIPINLARKIVNVNSNDFNPSILVKGAEDQSLAELEADLMGVVRSIRKMKPMQEENFALNKITAIINQISQIFGTVSTVGWIIALFSILVGGFSIANIMFVSVKERTNLIGVEKALGAPNYYILIQFLSESVILCLMGGLIGIVGVWLVSVGVTQLFDFNLELGLGNILIGVLLSSGIGIVSGFLPALQASRLNPIEAIRTKV